MAIKTLYTLLGVEPIASPQEIEDAFLRLKVRYPESKLAVDEAARNQFQAIQQAYATLGNPDSRSLYDRKLASAGMRVARPEPLEESETSWMSTRNIVVGGTILLIGATMWFYHAREQARVQQEIADRALKVIEEERRQKAELAAQEAQRRQTLFEEGQRQREEAQARQLQNDAQRTVQQTSAEIRRAQQEADAAQRKAQLEQQQKQRAEDLARRQAEQEAARRVADEKRQLRDLCMQKYHRPDC